MFTFSNHPLNKKSQIISIKHKCSILSIVLATVPGAPSPPRPREITEVKQLKIFANEEEKLKEKEEKEKKIKERKIIKNETLISHLADCNQIFIDNINGLNVNFTKNK